MPSNAVAYEPYYVENDREILGFMNEVYEMNSSQWLQFMYEGDIDTRFAAGDQEAIYNYMAANFNFYKRNQINFNLIRSVRNMVTGYQRKNRKSSIVIPQEEQDQETADQLSALLLWSMKFSNGYETISKCFEGALTVGMNLMSLWMDYTQDPLNGDIKCGNIAYNQFLIDPFFKNMDLSDCNYVWTRHWKSKNQLMTMLPGREKELMAMPIDGTRDGKFPYMPESLNYWSRKLFAVDEFWYSRTRKVKMLLDNVTGETLEYKSDKEFLDRFLQQNPQIDLIEKEIPTVKQAIVVNNRVMVKDANPYNLDRYPYVPFVGYFEPEIPYFQTRIQGMIRDLRAPQWCYNYMMKQNLDYKDAGIYRGYKFIEDAVVDPEDLFKKGSGTNIAIKRGHDLNEVQEILPPNIPASWFQEIGELRDNLYKISGVNEELLGAADDDKAGVLSLLRQGAGLTTLQPLFDNLDYSQKILGQLYLQLIQNNFSEGKIQRILNKEPTNSIKQKSFLKFDCQVIDGAMTPTQQRMEFMQLWEMSQAGLPIPPDLLLKNAPLQNKSDLINAIMAQQQQQQQMQQQQMQLQMQELKDRTNLLNARATAEQGLGLERASRIQENQMLGVERAAKAKEDRTDADLNKIRAIKELQSIDLNQLEQLLNILDKFKQRDALNEGAVGQNEKRNEEIASESSKASEARSEGL